MTVAGAIGGWAARPRLSPRALGGRLPLPDLLADAIRHRPRGLRGLALRSCARAARSSTRSGAAPGFADDLLDSTASRPKAGAIRRKPGARRDARRSSPHAGLDDFYRGDIGREIAADLERLGAPVTRADLEAYRAVVREPLSAAAARTRRSTTSRRRRRGSPP